MPEPTSPAYRRVLDAAARKGMTLDVIEFPGSTHTAEEAARALDAEPSQIVKSIVFVVPREDGSLDPYVVLVSGSDRVDPVRLAAVSGEPGIRKATAREAQDLTGYPVGGIPPFGHRTSVKVIMDPGLGRHEVVWASAGTSNALFATSPTALRSLANAAVLPVVLEPIRPGHGFPAPMHGSSDGLQASE